MFGKGKLESKNVAIIAMDGYEESELLEPKKILEDAGAKTFVVSIKAGKIRGWKHGNWSKFIGVDKTIDEISVNHYHAVLLPGGVINADNLRTHRKVIDLVKQFIISGKTVAAICHAPWVLIETGTVRGRKMTSWPSLKTDLENAGAMWMDQQVVTENGWVTSRKPEDIPAFCEKMIEEIIEGHHQVLPIPEKRAV